MASRNFFVRSPKLPDTGELNMIFMLSVSMSFNIESSFVVSR